MGALAYLDSLAIGTSIELTTQRGERVFATGVAATPALPFALATTAAFTMPAVNGVVVAAMNTTAPLAVGMWLFVPAAGWLAVTAIGGPTLVTLRNIAAVAGNAPPTTVIAPALAVAGGPALEPTTFDVRRYGATPSDVGPGIQAALTAAAANFGGRAGVPPLFGGALWNWVTPVRVDLAGTNPGAIELVGDATNIQILSSDVNDNLLVILNAQATTVRISGLVFVGNPAVGQDCVNLLEVGFVGRVVIEHIVLYGVQALLSLFATACDSANFDDININASSQTSATSGMFNCANVVTDIGNVRILDIGQFDASLANKVAGQCYIYVSSGESVSIHDCMFDEDSQRQVYIAAAPAGLPVQAVQIHNCRFLVPNPAAGKECAIKTDGPAIIHSLDIDDCAFPGPPTGIIANLANVDNVRFRSCFTSGGATLLGHPGPLDCAHLIEVRTGVGNVTITDCDPALALAPTGGRPLTVTLTQNGATVNYLYGIPGLLALYDVGQDMAIAPAFNLGVGGGFAAVTAGHQLNLTHNTFYPAVVTFAGTENSAASFAATIQAALNVTGNWQGSTATVVGGQVEITLPPQSGANAFFITQSEGAVTASDADVLASLGMHVGAFTNPSTAVSLGDSVATDATHDLTVLAGTPVYKTSSANFKGRPTITTAVGDSLKSSVWTAPVPQPFSVVVFGRVSNGGLAMFFDGIVPATPVSLEGDVGGAQVIVRSGGAVGFAATPATPSVFIYRFTGGTCNFAQNTITQSAPAASGANGLTGVTFGNEAGNDAGGTEIALIAVFDHDLTLTERRLAIALGTQRFGFVEV